MVEGVARVVAADGSVAWLEPEPGSSCGGCMSAALCGTKAGGSRQAAKRFPLANDADLHVGERVVVGIEESSLLRASMVAYGLPLAAMLTAAVVASKIFMAGDGAAGLAGLAGLLLGLAAARLCADRLSIRGELTPHFLRRALAGEDCHPHKG